MCFHHPVSRPELIQVDTWPVLTVTGRDCSLPWEEAHLTPQMCWGEPVGTSALPSSGGGVVGPLNITGAHPPLDLHYGFNT
jgi:hypothetical protein